MIPGGKTVPHYSELADLGPLPDHTNHLHLELIANAINMLEGDDKHFFAYEMVNRELMRFPDEVTMFAIDTARAQGNLLYTMRALFHYQPELIDPMGTSTRDWLLNGTDESDSRSAGGFNEEELMTLYASLYVARMGLTVVFPGDQSE